MLIREHEFFSVEDGRIKGVLIGPIAYLARS
jgi:hypothetical protein